MKYVGDKDKIEWEGRTGLAQGQACLFVGPDEQPTIAVGTGAVVPENWIGERVKITVERIK